jgi:DNA processing protein
MDDMRILEPADLPAGLRQLPQKPAKLYLRGSLPSPTTKVLCVVGSRAYSDYGRDACEALIEGLRGHPVCIVSGLALGIDSIAHKAALRAGLTTLALPGSSLDDRCLYPRIHASLAKEIVASGGGLLSEYPPGTPARPYLFPERNRLMAGLSDAVLLIEGRMGSGSLITANLALEYDRNVLVLPGSIFSETAAGTHHMLRQGAMPVRTPADILEALGIDASEGIELADESSLPHCGADERALLRELREPRTRDGLLDATGLDASSLSQLLTLLELKGLITISPGVIRRLR